jgi:hypothetical protein
MVTAAKDGCCALFGVPNVFQTWLEKGYLREN